MTAGAARLGLTGAAIVAPVVAALVAQFPAPGSAAYLAAFLLIAGAPLGAAALLMLIYVSNGRWAGPARRPLEAAAAATPLLGPLLLPIALLAPNLYPWAAHRDPDHPIYFDPAFVAARALAIVLLWTIGGPLLARASRAVPDGVQAPPVLRRACAGGLVLYALSMTGAAADWFGSMQPHWHSSIFATILMCSQALCAAAVAALCASVNGRGVSRSLMTDLGNLLLTFAVLHAYVAFSQFFIVWNGNVSHRTAWYIPRARGWWLAVIVAVAGAQFAIPVAALLFRRVKRSRAALGAVASVVLLGSVFEAAWVVVPGVSPPGAAGPVLYALIAALLALVACTGGTFVGRWAFKGATP